MFFSLRKQKNEKMCVKKKKNNKKAHTQNTNTQKKTFQKKQKLARLEAAPSSRDWGMGAGLSALHVAALSNHADVVQATVGVKKMKKPLGTTGF